MVSSLKHFPDGLLPSQSQVGTIVLFLLLCKYSSLSPPPVQFFFPAFLSPTSLTLMGKPVIKIEGVNNGLNSGDPKGQGPTQTKLG